MDKMPSPLPPPTGWNSWLAYAIATMETRQLWLEYMDGEHRAMWPDDVQRDDMRKAAQDELEMLLTRNL